MKITIDTKEDSPEDIRKVISLLSRMVEGAGSNASLFGNSSGGSSDIFGNNSGSSSDIFGNSQSPSQSESSSSQSSSSSPAPQNAFANMFGSDEKPALMPNTEAEEIKEEEIPEVVEYE